MSDPFDWTDAAIATLRRLWGEGQSARIIGEIMGVSKCAVVGKAHRLDLPGRPSPIKGAGNAPRRSRAKRVRDRPTLPPLASAPAAPPKAAAVAATPPQPVAPAPAPSPAVRCLVPRGALPCCWPIGEPGDPSFRFCDAPAPRQPYCDAHRARAYMRTQPGRLFPEARP